MAIKQKIKSTSVLFYFLFIKPAVKRSWAMYTVKIWVIQTRKTEHFVCFMPLYYKQ